MQVQLEHGSTLWVYFPKRGPMSILGTTVYPRSHLCMSLKRLATRLSAREQSLGGYSRKSGRPQWAGYWARNLSGVSRANGLEDNWGPRMDLRPMKPHGKWKRWNPKTSPLYVFSTTIGPSLEGLSPLPFCMWPHVYPLCYSGFPDNCHYTGLWHSLT